MFKPGDKVRALQSHIDAFDNIRDITAGKVYICNEYCNYPRFIDDTGNQNGWSKEYFELVNPLKELTASMEKISGIRDIPRGVINGPRVTKNEQICYFDVDETLVKWSSKKVNSDTNIKADYYGQKVYLQPYFQHINFLKAMKARGAHIIVHSGNGWAWAEQVVNLLNLQEYVDEIKSKPTKVVDDSPYENWMPTRIFIKE